MHGMKVAAVCGSIQAIFITDARRIELANFNKYILYIYEFSSYDAENILWRACFVYNMVNMAVGKKFATLEPYAERDKHTSRWEYKYWPIAAPNLYYAFSSA